MADPLKPVVQTASDEEFSSFLLFAFLFILNSLAEGEVDGVADTDWGLLLLFLLRLDFQFLLILRLPHLRLCETGVWLGDKKRGDFWGPKETVETIEASSSAIVVVVATVKRLFDEDLIEFEWETGVDSSFNRNSHIKFKNHVL